MRWSNLRIRSKCLHVFRLFIILSLIWSQPFSTFLSTASAAEEKITVSEIEFQGNSLFSQKTLQTATQVFVGSNKTGKDLEEIQNVVFSVYKNAGYSLTSVLILKYPDSMGRLTVTIKEDVLRNVTITGNKYLQEAHVRKALAALRTGTAINTKALDRQILVANDNPSRVIAVTLQPIDIGVFDAIITVKEDAMITQSVSVDNTGDPYMINYRFTDAGLGNRRDATGSFIYSRNPSNSIQQYVAYYNQPLSSFGNSLYLMAAYSNSNTGLAKTGYGDFNTSGAGHFYGMHYVHPLYRSVNTKLALDFGLEYRNSINNTKLENASDIKLYPDVNSLPLSITLQYNGQGKTDTFSSNISYVRNNPGGYLNNNYIYGIVWPGASANYQFWRGNMAYMHRFKNGWIFNNRVDGQYTAQSLIPDEQYSLGGAHSVRGFGEREFNGDKGFSTSFELYTPPLGHGIRLLAFYDIGQIWGYEIPAYGESKGELVGPATVSSTGVGIRWMVNRWLSFNADYAYVLRGAGTTPDHATRVHFEMTALF